VAPGDSAPVFKDHFSEGSAEYARYRPSYPVELFEWLASLCERRDKAWDCATGSGQVAVALAAHFAVVSATDASAAQIAAAVPDDRVRYSVSAAESTPFPSNTFDLVTVGQALHWFDSARFFAEAARVAVGGALLAAWCYATCRVSADVDRVIAWLYEDLTGPFWPPERRLIERSYRDFVLPGAELESPAFDMQLDWHADDMLGYLRTWSACRRYAAEHGSDPVDRIESTLNEAWGDAARTVRWPLKIRACRLPA